MAPGTSPTAPASTPSPTAAALVLTGKIEGGTPLDVSGTVSPLGAVTGSGTLSASGAEPMTYTGTFTLVGASGSVTLSLSGRVFGPAQLGGSIDLTYTVTGGTGEFQGATGSGKAVLSVELPPNFEPDPAHPSSSFVLTFGDLA